MLLQSLLGISYFVFRVCDLFLFKLYTIGRESLTFLSFCLLYFNFSFFIPFEKGLDFLLFLQILFSQNILTFSMGTAYVVTLESLVVSRLVSDFGMSFLFCPLTVS